MKLHMGIMLHQDKLSGVII